MIETQATISVCIMSDPRRAYSASVTVSLEASEDDDDDKEERMATMETTHDETEAAYASQ